MRHINHHVAPYWVVRDRISGLWKVGSIRKDWPCPYPRFMSWREAFDFASTLARVSHVAREVMKELP